MPTDDLERAQLLVDLDRDAEARTVLGRLLADDPEDPQLLCLLAQACLGLRDDQAALGAAWAAAQAAPTAEWPLRLLALSFARTGRRAEARAAADRAVATDPDGWLTHLVRAQVELIAGAVTATAEQAARTAVRLAPFAAEAHRVLGNVVLARRPRRGVREAERELAEALRLAPDDAGITNDLARVHVRRRASLGRAAAGFARAAALAPNDEIAAGNLLVVGARALGVIHLVLWLSWLVSSVIDVDSGGRTGALVAVAVDVVVIGIFGLRFWRDTRPRTRRLAALVLRRDHYLAVWAAFLVGAFALMAVAAGVGGTQGPIGTFAFWLLLGATVTTFLRARGVRRRLTRGHR